VHRKRIRVVVQRGINLTVRRRDDVVRHARQHFFDVADADGAADGGRETGAGGEGDVERVFVAGPFREGEEAAEVREAEADGFVGAEGLGVVWVVLERKGV
jgi:hypothetical protein